MSGLLKEQIGGPGVYPYQPKGLWEEIAFGDGFIRPSYHAGSRRRSLPPQHVHVLEAHQSAAGDDHASTRRIARNARRRRTITNTPLQALVLLNDPAFVEAARALAERMMTEGGESRRRIALALRLPAGDRARTCSRAKSRSCVTRSMREAARLQAASKTRGELLTVGESASQAPRLDKSELAAWTTVPA